ncbi:hypothetical protein GUITHDRAFT_143153 [Guillardia theta CCMP2712]|uniref:Uncharacterized protein n=1 Tax=Guillardia theta (strain CCMP2712) TaxID=905079 RepID=L1IUU1_GUITC|nr:hypothetical protein GUITHDRAFT_143153 [Guillardia theta CCMP2712]EKX40003.1 hypothetical protein GUITHDRAFT_143153 [Guillardia theta CCMP2712]|mmetsp:Transcript_32875/g.103958  ORF Transcript_32875/g.103958 Transcript_32875/m.103958 type:complete len:103 (-) Transcript_32875:199-507(-)|eukprot:XP_005826983.1 hypothetical protein GUITHDRAFT_143153 [Guillardia theta CCMP2712]
MKQDSFMDIEVQNDFDLLTLSDGSLPDDISTDGSELFGYAQAPRSRKGSMDSDEILLNQELGYYIEGPCREKQLNALRHCIELLSRPVKPEIVSATGGILLL